ncbi:MAG: phosphoribosylformylglycinamidine synthase subunit PurQ [Calditrichia bacterium]|nr:phosphoribosylformylglycinamidine synthase subunit PurQ [Calditrichia bacterium]
MKVAIIVFPGSNCDHDAYYSFKKILNVDTDFVWHKESNLDKYDLIVLPGGFSYGDYLRCGAISRFSPVMKSIVANAKKGKLVIGICNGFQILTESGLLPGALIKNENRQFVCKNVKLRVDNSETNFTNLCNLGDTITIPIAHGEGNYYCEDNVLEELKSNQQVVFRYVDDNGQTQNQSNPNGSKDNIAGIINKQGNVLGMMPHPERNAEKLIGNADGLKILNSILTSFGKN